MFLWQAKASSVRCSVYSKVLDAGKGNHRVRTARACFGRSDAPLSAHLCQSTTLNLSSHPLVTCVTVQSQIRD